MTTWSFRQTPQRLPPFPSNPLGTECIRDTEQPSNTFIQRKDVCAHSRTVVSGS